MKKIMIIIGATLFASLLITSCGGGKTNTDEQKDNSSESKDEKESPYQGNSGSFIDERDNQTYNWVKIDGKIWMAQNLNFEPEDKSAGVCYGGRSSNCDEYGRLYHPQDMVKSNYSDGYAPKGWHIASEKEWSDLLKALGGDVNGVSKLINGDFKAKFGGYGVLGSTDYKDLSTAAYFWATSGDDFMKIVLTNDKIEFTPVSSISNDRHFLYSIRCVAD